MTTRWIQKFRSYKNYRANKSYIIILRVILYSKTFATVNLKELWQKNVYYSYSYCYPLVENRSEIISGVYYRRLRSRILGIRDLDECETLILEETKEALLKETKTQWGRSDEGRMERQKLEIRVGDGWPPWNYFPRARPPVIIFSLSANLSSSRGEGGPSYKQLSSMDRSFYL